MYAVRRIKRATGFNAAQYGEPFRCVHVANGTAPPPRECFTLQPPDDFIGRVCNPSRRKLNVPLACYRLEAVLGRRLAGLLHHARINAIGQVLAGLTAAIACLGERNVGMDAEGDAFFFAAESVLHAPIRASPLALPPRYMPFASAILYVFSRGLAFRAAASDRGIGRHLA